MTVDYPDYQEPQANATAISVTGTPLLHGWDAIASTNTAVPANSTVTATYTVAKPGYEISVWAAYMGASGANPMLGVHLTWKNPNSGNSLAEEQWFMNVASHGAFQPQYGKGPSKTDQVQIQFTNFDPAQAIQVFYEFSETTHHIARDDWRGLFPGAIPGFTGPPDCNPPAGLLGAGVNTTIAASASISYLLPLYSGQAYLTAELSQGSTITITSLMPFAAGDVVWTQSFVTMQPQSYSIALPRSPCTITFTNLSSTNACTFTWHMGYLEYAS